MSRASVICSRLRHSTCIRNLRFNSSCSSRRRSISKRRMTTSIATAPTFARRSKQDHFLCRRSVACRQVALECAEVPILSPQREGEHGLQPFGGERRSPGCAPGIMCDIGNPDRTVAS